jgi:hypothetical protein
VEGRSDENVGVDDLLLENAVGSFLVRGHDEVDAAFSTEGAETKGVLRRCFGSSEGQLRRQHGLCEGRRQRRKGRGRTSKEQGLLFGVLSTVVQAAKDLDHGELSWGGCEGAWGAREEKRSVEVKRCRTKS